MSAFYLQMAAPVTQVAFCCAAESSNDVAVLLCTGQLVIYTSTLCTVSQFFIVNLPQVGFISTVDSRVFKFYTELTIENYNNIYIQEPVNSRVVEFCVVLVSMCYKVT